MSDTLPISAILITKNEAHNLPRCLGSLQFCAEIIVVDSGSTDDTVAIAESLGAQVTVTQDWPGFGPQKNRALDRATQPWVLSIDADEWLTPELADSIRAHVTGRTGPAQILRASSFCGQVMRYSGWGDDWVLRLFPRDTGRFSDDLVHERVVVDGTPSDLSGLLNHESFTDLSQVLSKIDHYSSAWAEQAYARGRRSSLAKSILKGFAAGFKTLILKQGFRDGARGGLLALTNAHGTFYKYAKLWLKS
jgi:glycosyltransferase involved in cell wall biosynthesis